MCLLYALSAWDGYISIDNVGRLNKILRKAKRYGFTASLLTFSELWNSLRSIGGGAYWGGRAVDRPLFAPSGQAMMFALPLFALLKFKKRAFLHPLVQC